MKIKHVLLASVLALTSVYAQAQLFRVGPTSLANGDFPLFYQDNGVLNAGVAEPMALDLCIPARNADGTVPGSELDQGTCLLLPADIPTPELAAAFPGNWPDEAFWWNGGASIPLGDGTDALLVMGLEAAFANGGPVAGDQIVFARNRVRFFAPSDGAYVVTWPYGQQTFNVKAGELIFYSDDAGAFCGLDFTCALRGAIGPFLRPSVNADPVTGGGGDPLPPVTIGARTYVADPADDVTVTGSPFNTNYFKIEGPDIGGPGIDVVETRTFNLMGRLVSGTLPSLTTPKRASYSRSATSAQIDVFASSAISIGQPVPQLEMLAEHTPGITLTHDVSKPQFFVGQSIPFNPTVLPNAVFLTNLADTPPSTQEVGLEDIVTITAANYDVATNNLTINATSSDTLDPPKLVAEGVDGTVLGELTAGTLTVNQPVAPENVTVISDKKGRATAPVITTAGAPAGGPEAVDDIDVAFNAPINVLANDINAVPPVTVQVIREPENGTAVVNADFTVSYSPRGSFGKDPGDRDSFTYVIRNASGVSNIASVDFAVTANNRPPVANTDTLSANRGAPVQTINVLLNDNDPDGDTLTITSATLTTVTSPAGTVSVNAAGDRVLYTPPVTGGNNAQTISYTISDGKGGEATGTVNVTLLAGEVVQFTQAQYIQSKRQWNLQGTDTPVAAGVVITIYAGSIIPADGVTNRIGTATTDAAGRWRLTTANNSPVNPVAARTVSAVSSRGGTRLSFPHTLN